MEWKCAAKMIAQISGQGSKAYPEIAADHRTTSKAAGIDADDEDSGLNERHTVLLEGSANDMCMELFGQTRSCLGWFNPAILYDEDPNQRKLVPTPTATPSATTNPTTLGKTRAGKSLPTEG